MFRFNRSQLFWYGVTALFACFVLYKCFLLLTWKHTTGTVIAYDVELPNGKTVRLFPESKHTSFTAQWSVVEFHANGLRYDFVAGENLNIPFGTNVSLLYSPRDPTKAFVNSFFGLWFRPLFILPLIVWAAIVMGLTGKNSFWSVRLRPFSITRIDIQKRKD